MFTAILILVVPVVLAQQQVTRDRSRDAFQEGDTGELTLRFYNALNAKPIPDASVTIDKVGEGATDFEGKFLFKAPTEDGFYHVTFKCDGYITSEFDIEIMAGTIFFNRYSISPVMDIRFLRVVIDWDENPKDLDAHFVKNGAYHISFRNMRVSDDKQAQLDRDCVTGYGPETITCTLVSADAAYEYFIHDFSNQSNKSSTKLSKSKATVKVFGEGRLMKVFRILQDKPGTIWKVFTIENGNVREDGRVMNP
jgi:hypothetical protein